MKYKAILLLIFAFSNLKSSDRYNPLKQFSENGKLSDNEVAAILLSLKNVKVGNSSTQDLLICKICSAKYGIKSSFQSHMLRKHGIKA